jgi:hypothetical protein
LVKYLPPIFPRPEGVMSISVSCPGCATRLNLADTLAGKTIKCFQCESTVTVPAADPADEYEVVDDRPTAKRVTARPIDDDRPRRRPAREEDEDEDDRSQRYSGKKEGVPVWVFAVAGGGLLLVLGVVALLVLWSGLGSKVPGAGGLAGNSAPPGYTAVRDAEGEYAVLLPGQIRKAEHRSDRPMPPGYAISVHGGSDGNWTIFARSMKPGNDFNPGTSPDQLYGLLKKHGAGIEAPWNEITSKTPITLGGKPALEVKVKEKKDWMGNTLPEADDDPRLPEEIRQHRKQVADSLKKSRDAELKKPGRREVYYVTTNGKRLIILHLSGTGDFPPEEMLKTIKDSFEFL